jgi:hypothetical protein
MSPPQGDCSSSNVLFQYIAIAYRDGSVKLIDKQTFQPMTTTNLDTGITDFSECNKRRRSIAYMTCMQQTWAGLCVHCSFTVTVTCVAVILEYVIDQFVGSLL